MLFVRYQAKPSDSSARNLFPRNFLFWKQCVRRLRISKEKIFYFTFATGFHIALTSSTGNSSIDKKSFDDVMVFVRDAFR